MSDPIPDNSHRIAYWIGRIFHPAVICIPTLILVLNDLTLMEALLWTALVATIILLPGTIAVWVVERQGKQTYQSRTRDPLYAIAWCSVIAAWLAVWLLAGPAALIVCLATLAVWLPLQTLVNRYVTKISTHTAVAAGCVSGVIALGKLPELWMMITGGLLVLVVAWARVMTKNHTLIQVVLGLLVGAGSVLLVFPLLLPHV